MANAIINVDVNDSQFKTLLTNAEKYKKAIESSNKAWKTVTHSATQLNAQFKKQADLYKQVFSGMAKYVANDAKLLVNNQKRNAQLKHQLDIHKQVFVGMGRYVANDAKVLANIVRRNVHLKTTAGYMQRIAGYTVIGSSIGRAGKFLGRVATLDAFKPKRYGQSEIGNLYRSAKNATFAVGGGIANAVGNGGVALLRGISEFISTALRFMRVVGTLGIGLATAGFFGLKGLAQSGADERRRGLQLGTEGGQLRASRFVYGRYFDVDKSLSAIQYAQANPNARRVLTGLNFENQNPTEVLPQLIEKMVGIYLRDPRNATSNLEAAGLEFSGISFEDVAQLARVPESERVQARTDFIKKSKDYKIGADDLKTAQDLNQKFIELTTTIKYKLIDVLVKVAPDLIKFTDTVIIFVQSISKKDIEDGFTKFTTFLNDAWVQLQKFNRVLTIINSLFTTSPKELATGAGDMLDYTMRQLMKPSATPTVTQQQIFGKVSTHGIMQNPRNIVMHHTGGRTVAGALDAFKEHNTGVQYIVDRDGNIIKLAPENAITQHVKPNKGITNANSIGIEFVGKNDADINDIQKKVANELVKQIMSRNPNIDTIIGHGAQAPAGNKQLTEGSSVVNFIGRANQIKVDNASGASLSVTSSVLQ
jgi:hypothetical protein